MKRALVTGSRGFLGRHFVQQLEREDWLVERVDLKERHSPRDVRTFLAVTRKSYDLAIHCAAYVGGRRAIDAQRTFLGAYNLQLDACFFQWALRARPDHIVYLSSSAVYPVTAQTETADRSGLQEALVDPCRDVLWQPDATYGFTKLVGERLAQELSDEAPDVAVHVVRPFSGYGEDQALDYPFPAFAARALEREDPFEIWGSGMQVRDWVHVDDVVGATLAAVRQDFREPLNICTGRATTFFDLADLFTKAAGYHPQLAVDNTKPTGVHRRVGDPTRLETIYVPTVTLEEGIRRALA